MLNSEKILAIITARGGSKGILHKNIKLLNGKPLISYTIESALKSKLIDEVIVSTDDDKISEISKQYGATVPFKRPKIFAKDSSSSESVIIHTLNWLETKNQKFFDLLPKQKVIKRRQDSPKLYYPNGAIYISKIDIFKKLKGFDESALFPFIMNEHDSIDIDSELDFFFAES